MAVGLRGRSEAAQEYRGRGRGPEESAEVESRLHLIHAEAALDVQ